MENRLHFFFIVFVTVIYSNLQASNIGVEEYHQEDGLPTDLIKAFEIDDEGYVWIASDGGVVKFEGKNFIDVENIERSSNYYKNLLFTKKYGFVAASDDGLISISKLGDHYFGEFAQNLIERDEWPDLRYAKTLYEATDSSLWIANNTGLAHLTDSVIQYYELPQQCHTNNYVRNHQFFELSGFLFVICQKGYLYSVDKKNHKLVPLSWGKQGTEVFSVNVNNDHSVLLGTKDGVLMLTFDDSGQVTKTVRLDFPYSVSVIKFAKDKIYLGTWSNGLFEANLDGLNFTYSHIKESEQRTINDLLIDNQNQIWLATNFGVVLLRNLDFSPVLTDYTQNYIQDLETYDGRVFVNDGWQVAEVDIVNKKLKRLLYDSDKLILQIIYKDNQLWISTDDGKIIILSDNNQKKVLDFSYKGSAIYSLVSDKQGNVWFLQRREKINLVRIDTKLKEHVYEVPMQEGDYLTVIEKSQDGTIYIGARGNTEYLWQYDSNADRIEDISKPLIGLKKNIMEINDMTFTSSGKIILATSEGIWEYSNQSMRRIDMGEMNVEYVTSVTLDKNERIWLVNSNGILLYDNKNWLIFNNYDGIPSKTNSPRNLLVDSLNQLWMGSNLGLVYAKIQPENKPTPKPKIKYIESGFKIAHPSKDSRFLENSQLDIYFTIPLYPAKYVSFEYSLQTGKIETWVPILKNTGHMVLQHLEPGNYVLKLRAKGKGFYNWSDSFEYHFKVYQKWYTNVWVLGLLYVMVVVIAFVYLHFARYRNRVETKKLEKVIDQRTHDLQEQNEELTLLNLNLQTAKETAEAAIKSKDRFFSILAHDLKSPFNTLIGFSELLVHNRDEISEDDMQKFLEEMLHTSENTYKLLQNLLDWARSQTGALKIKKQTFSFNELMQEILTTINATANQKEISLVLDIPPELNIYADVSLIATVVRNLIMNAIKFSHSNTEVKIVAKALDVDWVEISVIDNGIGVEQEKLPDLFTIDKNISTLGTANEKGTGLGLILCKEFIEKCNGTISVESQIEKGSTFKIQLPGHE